MNVFKRVWDGGYAARRAKIMATGAGMSRKLAACNRVFLRMCA